MKKGKGKYRVAGRGVCFVLAAVFFLSCTARLDISTNSSGPRIVVYGTVTTDHQYHPVTISATEGFFSGEHSRLISGAEVTVSDGQTTRYYYESSEGHYLPVEAFAGISGRSYTLQVSLDVDGDGEMEVYYASTRIPPPVEIERIRIRKSTTISNRYEILFWGDIPYDKGYYLSFSIARDSGPFSDSLSKYNILEDRYFGTGYLDGLPCFFLNRESGDALSYGDIVGIKVDVLPGDYGKFLGDAQSELTGAIPLFSGPPANVGTNIVRISGSAPGEPLGFFGSAATARSYTVFEDDAGEPEYPRPLD